MREETRPLAARDDLVPLYCADAVPDRAHVVPVGALASADPTDVSARLRKVLHERPPTWSAVDHLCEVLVRPVVVTVRELLAEGLVPVGEVDVAVSGATGRVVLPDVAPADVEAVSRCVRDVDRGLDRLARVCSALLGADVGEALERVLAHELAHLEPRVAALLDGDHPWRRFARSVPPAQDEVLRSVLRRVRERSARRRADPALPRPVVAVDLDFCALHPRRRVRTALRRVGRVHGVAELAGPLDVLPGLYEPGWASFVEHHGLHLRRPDLDWGALYREYRASLSWSGDALATDEIAPGLVRFVRDVERAGGRVVCPTGRREHMRAATASLLARHGLGHLELRTMADDDPRGTARHKVEALRGMDVVAAFDDLAGNRVALLDAFPEAIVVAVRPPGFSTGEEAAVGTFERLPHPRPVGRGHHRARPSLSHTTSLADLSIGDLSTRPTVWQQGVELSSDEQLAVISDVCSRAREAGHALGRRVRAATPPGTPTSLVVHRVLIAKAFGTARSAYPPEAAEADMAAAIEAGEPIPFVLLGPPTKQDGSRLKALGGAPDLSEVGMVARLLQLDTAVRQVYAPGVRISALTDPSHFRFREPGRYADYHHLFDQLLKQAGADRFVTLTDIDDAADEHPRCGDRAERPRLLAEHRARYEAAFAGLDVRRDPPAALAEADARDPGAAGMPRFVEMFRSVLHAVDVPHRGGDPLAWSQRLYADPLDVVDPAVPAEVRHARADLLELAWQETITYLANKHVDEDLDYAQLWKSDCVRMSLSIRPALGRYRFVPIGGSGVMPWHGTAALNDQCEISVDYVLSLADQGFRPVYVPGMEPSETTGIRQPWFMAPTRLLDGGVSSLGIRLRSR
ncbi:L-tyrosine/L-tryptophan isonitrile synthase family protein [Saccharopolyspora rosea]|uniref:L-tyrosine/L-tryptophan isonitrile synthase family protein n=2 Tax=Saccharopolyspora rosea TaxID=524884 RepID=A0ABW3FVD5_9PSEU